MDKIRIRKLISSLAKRDYRRMYMNDFFLTWYLLDAPFVKASYSK